jgi:hypothetical protein
MVTCLPLKLYRRLQKTKCSEIVYCICLLCIPVIHGDDATQVYPCHGELPSLQDKKYEKRSTAWENKDPVKQKSVYDTECNAECINIHMQVLADVAQSG